MLWYRTGSRDYIFLIDQCWHKLEAIEPDNTLFVVGIGPQSMVHVIRTHSYTGVITNEATAKPIAGVDRVRAGHLHATCANVRYIVIQASIMDVAVKRITFNST